jgi:hypothetical protein
MGGGKEKKRETKRCRGGVMKALVESRTHLGIGGNDVDDVLDVDDGGRVRIPSAEI